MAKAVYTFTVNYNDEFKPTLRAFKAKMKERDESVSGMVREFIAKFVAESGKRK